jgi:hypothetical protein
MSEFFEKVPLLLFVGFIIDRYRNLNAHQGTSCFLSKKIFSTLMTGNAAGKQTSVVF